MSPVNTMHIGALLLQHNTITKRNLGRKNRSSIICQIELLENALQSLIWFCLFFFNWAKENIYKALFSRHSSPRSLKHHQKDATLPLKNTNTTPSPLNFYSFSILCCEDHSYPQTTKIQMICHTPAATDGVSLLSATVLKYLRKGMSKKQRFILVHLQSSGLGELLSAWYSMS